jgi:hypothetical protein
MSGVQAIVRAAVEAGEPLDLRSLGGEEAIYADAAALAVSVVFGDVTEILAREWRELIRPEQAEHFITVGLRENADRLVLGHAVEALAQAPLPELRAVVMALDYHARDTRESEVVRLEAASGVVRFALAEPRWRSTASAVLVTLEDVQDETALDQLARLAAVGWEQFRDNEMLRLLERHEQNAQAAYERGVIGLALALEEDSLESIALRIHEATTWLKRSVRYDEERRDTRVYLLLARALEAISLVQPAPRQIAAELRDEAVARYHWDEPRPGAEWLLPPHEAELQWIPVVDQLVRVSERLVEPSWFDAASVLSEVVKTYIAVRSIRPGLHGVERVMRPAIEAAFVRERGLLAHLHQWIERGGAEGLDTEDVRRLRENIELRRIAEGKAPGTPPTGRPSSRKSRPD